MSGKVRIHRVISDQTGSSAIEFAIVGPLFLMMFFGVLSLGWTIYTITNVNFAAERASRILRLNSLLTETQLSAAVKAQLPHLEQDDVSVTLEVDTGAGGYRLGRVTVTYEYVFDIPFIGSYPLTYNSTVSVPMLSDLG